MKGLRLVSIGALVAIVAAATWWTRTHPAGGTPPGNSPDSPPVTWTPVAEQSLQHGRFNHLSVYSPHGAPRGFVLYLSGTDGWTQSRAEQATALAAQGALVVGIDLREFTASLEDDGASCVFPDGDLENLSHFVQAYYRVPTYLSPILTGESAGGTLAYATLVQAPANTFAAAVSMGFCPGFGMHKPLCGGSGVEFKPRSDGGVDFLPAKQLSNPWVVFHGVAIATPLPSKSTAPECDTDAVARFVSQIPAAKLVTLQASTPTAAPAAWPAAYAAEFAALLAQFAPAASAAPDALKDLPLVTVPAQAGVGVPAKDSFAIILSGDGGWAGLDKEVAGALAAQGIAVIGVDSLRYFWTPRTPEGMAADLDRIIGYYGKQLGKQRVMVIGYSQGADVLPFAVNRLPAATRAHVTLAAVMGMSEHALFEFHVSSWLADDQSGPATLPEVARLDGMPVLCIYGDQEDDSLCPKLDAHKVMVVKLKGGHHFDGNYLELAQTILSAARK